MLINGPFPAAREWLTVSIQENDTVGYLMKLLLTDEKIMEIEQEQNQTVFEPADLPEMECAHIWKKATCTVPPICEICGTTRKKIFMDRIMPYAESTFDTSISRQIRNLPPSSSGIVDTDAGDTMYKRIISNILCTNMTADMTNMTSMTKPPAIPTKKFISERL